MLVGMTTDASIPETAGPVASVLSFGDRPEGHFLRMEPADVNGRRFKIAAPFTRGGSLDQATRAGLE
jgi:hypothetical protein